MNMSASTPNTEADWPADDVLNIAVGILRDRASGRVLIAQRRPDSWGAGYWEFPGGKREPGEAMSTTLAREIEEELGVVPQVGACLVRMRNPVATFPVRLHVWLIDQWQGTPYGREGQHITWAPQPRLPEWKLLPGNRALLNALGLPARFAITPAYTQAGDRAWFAALAAVLAGGIRLLRLRAPELGDATYADLAARVITRAHADDCRVVLDRSADMVHALGADGLHWSAERAAKLGERPLGLAALYCVSAHSAEELAIAVEVGADCAVLSAVHATPSHPHSTPLGWAGWQALRSDFGLPVYALGGVAEDDLDVAKAHNAQGIAGIRAFWLK